MEKEIYCSGSDFSNRRLISLKNSSTSYREYCISKGFLFYVIVNGETCLPVAFFFSGDQVRFFVYNI